MMKMPARVSRTVAATSLMIFALASPASSAPSGVPAVPAALASNGMQWSSPTDVAEGGVLNPLSKIALSVDGSHAVAVWEDDDGIHTFVRTRSATITSNIITWGAVTELSAEASPLAAGNFPVPEVALSADGSRATAVWRVWNGTPGVVRAASAIIVGDVATWSVATDLSDTTVRARNPQIALSADGTRATATWDRFTGTVNIAQTRSATIAGNVASWSPTTDLSDNSAETQIAVSADGSTAVAIWKHNSGMQARSATIAGNVASWGAATTDLSTPGNDTRVPQIVLSRDGTRAAAAWTELGTDKFADVQVAVATLTGSTGSWSAGKDPSETSVDSLYSQIAMSADGDSVAVAWLEVDKTGVIFRANTASVTANTATWGAATNLSALGGNPQGYPPFLKVALSADGARASALWVQNDGTDVLAQSASATIDGHTARWGPASNLSAPGVAVEQQLALSGDGTSALAIWSRQVGKTFTVQSASGLVPRPVSAGLHVQLQATASCRSNSVSAAWVSGVPAVGLVGAYQIGDVTNQETYVVGVDGAVYHNYLVDGGWVGWGSLSGPVGGIFGTVRAGLNYLGNQELFVRGVDGQVYHLFATPGAGSGWGTWDRMGAPQAGVHGDVYQGTNSDGHQELFVLGDDGVVYHRFATPGVGTGWSGWDPLGAPAGVSVTGDVQLAVDARCNQELFVTGTDGNVYHSYATPGEGGGWSTWSTLGGPAAGVKGFATVGQNEFNHAELFVVGADDVVYHDYSVPGVGSGWSGWSSVGAPSGAVLSTSVWVDTFPVQQLTVWTTTGEWADIATPGTGGGWAGWTRIAGPPNP